MGGGFDGDRRLAGRRFIVCAIGEGMVKKSDIVGRVVDEAGVTKRATEGAVGRSNAVSFRLGTALKDALT